MNIVPEPTSQLSYEAGTEGLRGFAALLVLYSHFLWHGYEIDPHYAPWSGFWALDASQGAVLLFFVISGYVIGLTNQKSFELSNLVLYAKRRIIRIYPLYFLAVTASLLVVLRIGLPSLKTIIGNYLFLQNDLEYGHFHVPLLKGNTNLWSLNYEVLYYILFPFVWYCRKRWPLWLSASAILGIIGWRIPLFGPVIASYAAGWTFWLAGYGLSQAPKVDLKEIPSPLPWPSLLLLWFATWQLKPLWWFCHRFALLPEGHRWMDFSYYDFILPCIALLMVASGRRPKGFKFFCWVTLVLPLLFICWKLLKGHTGENDNLLMNGFIITAAVLWRWKPSTQCLERLAQIGAISYAIYIFQRPVQWFVRDYLPLPSGTAWSFSLRLAVVLILTFYVSYLAEQKIQPWIKRKLN